jgi:ATP-dependent DNA helicase RecQ
MALEYNGGAKRQALRCLARARVVVPKPPFPALALPGLGLVISPLIAQMADQIAALQQLGISAERLDSSTSLDFREDIWRPIKDVALDLLYLSPEGLMQPSMLERLTNLPLALVAIDEAHCVSQWGHDFRPEYRMLGRLADIRPR